MVHLLLIGYLPRARTLADLISRPESRNFMPELTKAALGVRDPTQARKLSFLVEVEARWENLRKTPSRPTEPEGAKEDLEGRQKAYEIYRAKLAAYNKQYAPAHVPELLLNTPSRLGKWCQAMRDLYILVEHDDPQGQCP